MIFSELYSAYYTTVARILETALQPGATEKDLQQQVLQNAFSESILTILPALQKIFCNYQDHLTVDGLAQLCNISKYHFCRIFKQQMGVTPVQYIIRYRLSVAELMLHTKNYSIREVATMCGFDDLSYFYRCYKKVNGIAPHKIKA